MHKFRRTGREEKEIVILSGR